MTPERRRNKKIRKKAREKHLDRLYAEQNSLCYWCKAACALVRFVPVDTIVTINNGHIYWRDGDIQFKARIATTDHVKRIADGGTNDVDNLVMACQDCNHNRDRNPKKYDPVKRVCFDCGEEKATPRFNRCKRCFVKITSDWLVKNGWTLVPETAERHCRFIDPVDGIIHTLRRAVMAHKKRMEA